MDDSSSYNDSNRAFVQAFLARGTLTYETSKPLLASIFTVHEGREILPNDITEADLRSYVSAANLALSPLDLEIRSTFHQSSRERVYALVNTSSDALTQMATTYSVEEMGFVKRVLDWMFDGPANTRRLEAMCISGTEAVNLAKVAGGVRRETQNGNTQVGGGSQGLSMRDAEGMMGRLVEEGWFEKSGKGFYNLTPRALMELRGWLVESYNDLEDESDDRGDRIKFCQACKEIVTVGQRCPKRECPCRLHDICTANFFRMQRNRNCPICKVEWDGKHFVGEKAITTSERYLQGKRRSGGSRRGRQEVEEADENEEA
ncbi:hypothetical protein GJ744_004118 [Endocarpon pusillum]|uniref:Non-structural maintenance of chromosomes element 1 homolog n=1 Tax=Endocarpon pusillum TaxID=364733 RepID=A0A8H7ALT4_9EURO|nr:hypothetical protein GJ744_004118 [Endocarpon pusillum]